MMVMHFYYTTELSYWQAGLIFHTVVKPPPHKANPFLDKKKSIIQVIFCEYTKEFILGMPIPNGGKFSVDTASKYFFLL